MKSTATRISLLDKRSYHHDKFRTAVSLHCHTQHSKENLRFVHLYAAKIPILSSFYKRERDRYFRLSGRIFDFAQGYWTPPVTVQRVHVSETERIERQLGLNALVSLTDHDETSTGMSLHALEYSLEVPISLEWTVPIGESVLHLGIHNLPSGLSTKIINDLSAYTLEPSKAMFAEILTWLNNFPETLVVLNHPLSDLRSVGIERLKRLIVEFLNRYGKGIHALEVNGYRSWSENHKAVSLAERFSLPVVSGGDRHGCAPNAILNLTNATSFSEFVSEIRYDKISEILIMPEYRNKNLYARKLESVADFFRDYPEYPHGHQRWTDRVFFQLEDGLVRPLSYYWQRTVPVWVKSVMWGIQLIGSRYLRPALRIAFAGKEKVAL
ncbi:MAG: hypothetical protein PVG99_04560 [Desulfobacteraceae bacterium]|jgi:hypothetical protein